MLSDYSSPLQFSKLTAGRFQRAIALTSLPTQTLIALTSLSAAKESHHNPTSMQQSRAYIGCHRVFHTRSNTPPKL